MGQMKNIVTHALNAVKDAMDEGIVPGELSSFSVGSVNFYWIILFCVCISGGGIGLLNASKELDKVQTTNHGQKIGVQIMQNALKVALNVNSFIFGFRMLELNGKE